MRPAALALLLTLVLALAACGDDEGDGGATTGAETTETTPAFEDPEPLPRTEVVGGYLYEVEEDGFEIAVPRRWVARSAAQVPDPRAIRRLSVDYPVIIGYFEALVGDSPTRFVAAAPNLRKNFATNLTVTIEEVEAGTTTEQYEEETYAEILSTAANVRGEIRRSDAQLPVGPVRVLRYERSFSDEIALETRHYFFVDGERAFALTYSTALPDPAFDAVVERSTESFRLTGN